MTQANEDPIPSSEPQVRWFIVLRPILIWSIVSLFILGYDYDRVNAPRTFIASLVTIDNVPQGPGQFYLEIDGSRVSQNDVVKVGTRNIRIWAVDTTEFRTNRLVWYGTNNLEHVALERLRGTVNLTLVPPATELLMVGLYDELNLSNVATLRTNIAVGRYALTLKYGDMERKHTVRVEADKTVERQLQPDIGIGILGSNPSGANFSLSSTNRRFRPKRGTLPIQLPLESGEYSLEAWRGSYRKEATFVVNPGKTNAVTIPFEYGRVEVSTEPQGVNVTVNRNSFGVTPTNFVLQPGSYQVQLAKSGFHSLNIPLKILPNQTVTLRTNLVSMGFSQALANAKRYARSKDFERALENIDSALSINPSHSESQQLRSVYQRELSLVRAREAATAKRQANISRLDTLTRADEDTALFDSHSWSFTLGFEQVRVAVRNAISKTSARYSVEAEQNLDPNNVFFRGKSKGLSANGRHCAVLVSSSQVNETQVVAKFWDYIPASGSGISIASLLKLEDNIPVHPDRFQANQRQAVLERRKTIADEFKELVDNELEQNN